MFFLIVSSLITRHKRATLRNNNSQLWKFFSYWMNLVKKTFAKKKKHTNVFNPSQSEQSPIQESWQILTQIEDSKLHLPKPEGMALCSLICKQHHDPDDLSIYLFNSYINKIKIDMYVTHQCLLSLSSNVLFKKNQFK